MHVLIQFFGVNLVAKANFAFMSCQFLDCYFNLTLKSVGKTVCSNFREFTKKRFGLAIAISMLMEVKVRKMKSM